MEIYDAVSHRFTALSWAMEPSQFTLPNIFQGLVVGSLYVWWNKSISSLNIKSFETISASSFEVVFCRSTQSWMMSTASSWMGAKVCEGSKASDKKEELTRTRKEDSGRSQPRITIYSSTFHVHVVNKLPSTVTVGTKGSQWRNNCTSSFSPTTPNVVYCSRR